MKRVIVDLDGTLANLDHRLHYVRRESPAWENFFVACGEDALNAWCADLMAALMGAGFIVEIVSGRPERCKVDTLVWLKQHGVQYHALYLLGDEKTPDHELKREWLRQQRRNANSISFVIDDRQKVVDMWRAEGLVCLQCDAWQEFRTESITPVNPPR